MILCYFLNQATSVDSNRKSIEKLGYSVIDEDGEVGWTRSAVSLRAKRDDLASLCLPNLLIFEPNNFVVWPTPQTASRQNKNTPQGCVCVLVGAGGVEPPQSKTTDLQSAPALRLRRAPETFYLSSFANYTSLKLRVTGCCGRTLDFRNRVPGHAITKIRGASRGNRTLISSLEGLHSSL